MVKDDFRKHRIKIITAQDIESSGSGLKFVPVNLIVEADKFIRNTHRKITIRPNGILSGTHRLEALHKGKAIDLCIGSMSVDTALNVVLKFTEFKGVGFYRDTENNISMHLDFRPNYTFWVALKNNGKWKYTSFPSQVV